MARETNDANWRPLSRVTNKSEIIIILFENVNVLTLFRSLLMTTDHSENFIKFELYFDQMP